MGSRLWWLLPAVCVAAACIERPRTGTVPEDGTQELSNKVLSIGILNNAGGPPNGVAVAHLNFNKKDPALGDEIAIVSVAVLDSSITLDGIATSPSEWAAVPFVDYSLSPSSDLLGPANPRNPDGLLTPDHGIYSVRVWSAYDSRFIYFRLEWSDATRNDVRARWTKTDTGWARNQGPTLGSVDPTITAPTLVNLAMDAGEDRAILSFDKSLADPVSTNGCAGLCHLEPGNSVGAPLVVDSANYYTSGGRMRTDSFDERADIWLWRATRSGGLRIADDQYFNCGTDDPAAACGGSGRIGDDAETDDFRLPAGVVPECTGRSVDPIRYPTQVTTSTKQLFANEYFVATTAGGCVSAGPSRRPADGSEPLFMYEAGSPFIGIVGPEAVVIGTSETFAVGETLPGYVHRNTNTPDLNGSSGCSRCNTEAAAVWEAGVWTLELRRSLEAPDALYDVDFTREE
jgi:hypothetical protein